MALENQGWPVDTLREKSMEQKVLNSVVTAKVKQEVDQTRVAKT